MTTIIQLASPIMSTTPQAGVEEKVRDAFRIDSMTMKDGASGELLWEANYEPEKWFGGGGSDNHEELTAHLPKDILQRQSVTREINFSSDREIRKLRLVQDVNLNGTTIEQWRFEFGFVVPGSTNSWQQTIRSNGNMMDASLISGNITIDTSFYDGDDLIARTCMRIYYD